MPTKKLTIEDIMRLGVKTGADHLRKVDLESIVAEMIVLKKESVKKDALIANLQADAMSDPLTGLANRRAFEQELNRSIAVARRYDRTHALLLIDVDNFKQVNDQLGHLTGDDVLRHVARLLRQNIRQTDIAARLGGDEFCVILNEIKQSCNGEDRAKAIAEIISNTPCIGAHYTVQVQVSVGCTVFGSEDDQEAVMRRADEAMYAQKSKHKAAATPQA